MRKLPSIAAMKDPRPWLAKNLQFTEEFEERRIRITFRAGKRVEQVVILNALVRVHLRNIERGIKYFEDCIRSCENWILDLQTRKHAPEHDEEIRKQIDYHRAVHIPAYRVKIDALQKEKQSAAVKWARKAGSEPVRPRYSLRY